MQEAAPVSPKPAIIRIRFWSELAVLALMLMELTILTAYYDGLTAYRIPWTEVVLVLGGILLASYYAMRILGIIRLSLRARRILFLAWLLLAIFGSLKILVLYNQPVGLFALLIHPFATIAASDINYGFAEFVHLILVSLLAWRGVTLARAPLTVGAAQRSFQIGLLVFMLYGITIARDEAAIGYTALFVFLFLGLVTMASARMASVTDLRGGRAGKFSKEWVLGLLAFALLIVVVVILLGLLLHQPVALIVGFATNVLFFLFSFVVLLLAYPLVLLLTYLIPLIVKTAADSPIADLFKQLQVLVNQIAGQAEIHIGNLTGVLTAGRLAGRILIFLGIVLAVLLAIRWKPFAGRNAGEEEVSDMPGTLRWPALPRLDPHRGLGRLTNAGRWLAAQRIRRIYAELMDLCANAGHPRPQAMTPQEFLPGMAAFLPGEEPDLEEITRAYQKVRYGMLPETPEEVRTVVEAWERVRPVGRKAVAEYQSILKAKKQLASKARERP